MPLWSSLQKILPKAFKAGAQPRDAASDFVSRSSWDVYTVVSNARRLRDDAKILFERGSYPTAAAIAILSVEESGKACLIQWAESKWLPREEVTILLTRHFDKQRILAPYMIARAMKRLAPTIKDGKLVGLEYSLLNDETFARKLLDYCYQDVWASLEMLADGGAFDHLKEIGLYVDVNAYLHVNITQRPISREESEGLIRCADLGIEAATADRLSHEAMMLFYSAEAGKAPNREKRAEFGILFREARARGLKGRPVAFGDRTE
jgi:AbiV family abortive infection protein